MTGTIIHISRESEYLGHIVINDEIKPDSKAALKDLKTLGISRTIMLTGDKKAVADHVASEVGVDEVHAELLPAQKVEHVESILAEGKTTAFVGDGINDAPALTCANLGIAIGAGTDVAIDAADVVLMKSSIKDVAAAIRISRSTLRNIHENLFWAFFYNVLGIPLAAGCYVAAFGWELNPVFGAAALPRPRLRPGLPLADGV